MSDASAGHAENDPAQEARGRASDDFDLGSLGQAIRASLRPILGLTLLALVGSFLYVNLATPRYTAEAAILLESADNFYTRPGGERDASNQPQPIDDQAVQSQVLLLSSRGLLIDAIRRLKLVGNAELDPLAGPPRPWTRLLILAGLVQNPANLSPEDRVLERFSERMRVYPARGSRVINIEFTSADPELAAAAANTMADLYLRAQENAKKSSARSAGAWLSGAIQPLRQKVDEAEAKVEAFRSDNGLLMGTNNVTINTQQLADLNTQLASARAAEVDLRAKAKLLREMIQQGRMLDVSEVANNDLIRRLSEQRATLSAQIALEGRTLLPQHPRMKELAAQLAGLDAQIRLAAEKTVRGLENDARVASARVESTNAALEAQKKTSSVGNEKEVQLRALERDAKAARDQLEAYMAKYREAAARDDDKAVPPDARIIAHALVPATPSFPKKIPIISIATLATFVLAVAVVVARELAFPSGARGPLSPAPRREPFLVRRRQARSQAQTQVEPQAQPQVRPDPAAEPPRRAPDSSSRDKTKAAAFDPARGGPQPLDAVAHAAPVGTVSVDAAPGEATSTERSAQPAPHSTRLAGQEPDRSEATEPTASPAGEAAAIASHLVSLKPPGRGIIVLVSRASDGDAGPSFALPLGRGMAEHCKAVVVDFDRQVKSLSRETGLVGAPGAGDLMANEIGFADAIHRDPCSDLHIVPAGSADLSDEAGAIADLPVVLQALRRTYDAVLVDIRPLDEPALLRSLIASVDVMLVVRGEADEAAMASTLARFAAERPALLLAVEPANDDELPPGAVAA